jgi:hypothetical protein
MTGEFKIVVGTKLLKLGERNGAASTEQKFETGNQQEKNKVRVGSVYTDNISEEHPIPS